MFIIITESGEPYKADTITEDDKTAANECTLSIIDVEDLQIFYGKEWHDMENWAEYR